MSIRIAEWDFDEHNTEELWRHGISDADVIAMLDGRIEVVRNKGDRAGSHKVIGLDRGGRLITIIAVPISTRQGIWRPITGWDSVPGEKTKWRGNR